MKLTQNQWIVAYVVIAVIAYWWFFSRKGKGLKLFGKRTEAPAPTVGEEEDIEAVSEDLGYTRAELSASRYHAGALSSMDNPMGLAGTYNTSDEHQGGGGYVM